MSMVNIFEDDWRDCLRAHYFHVIAERDVNNERSLVTVLLQTGFTEDDIAALRSAAIAEYGWESETPEAPATEADAALVESAEAVAEEAGEVEPENTADAVPPGSGSDSAYSGEDGRDEPPAPLVQMSLF
jgi:hypothetical protein